MSFFRDVLNVPLPSRRLLRERVHSWNAVPNPNPLFVFGNQKSGTTVIASLLAAATGKSTTLDFAGAMEPYASELLHGGTTLDEFVQRNAWAFSADIVKEPMLTFVAPALMDHFGTARAIFITRNPFDNIRSILSRLKLRGDYHVLPTGARLNPTWRKILAGIDLGIPSTHYIDALARRWVRSAQILQSRREQFVLGRYEDFTLAKNFEIARLAGALDMAVMADVTSLLEREYQPRDAVSASPEEFFGDNYARIDAICKSFGQMLGYGYAGVGHLTTPQPLREMARDAAHETRAMETALQSRERGAKPGLIISAQR